MMEEDCPYYQGLEGQELERYFQPPLPYDQTVSPEGIAGEETFDSNS